MRELKIVFFLMFFKILPVSLVIDKPSGRSRVKSFEQTGSVERPRKAGENTADPPRVENIFETLRKNTIQNEHPVFPFITLFYVLG